MDHLTPEQIAAILAGVAAVIGAGATWGVRVQRKQDRAAPSPEPTLRDLVALVTSARDENRDLHRERERFEDQARADLVRLDERTRPPWRGA